MCRFYVRALFLLLPILGLAVLPHGASAQDVGIAAVVNDTMISKADVQARMRLMELNSSIPNDPQTQARLAQDVLHQLIDETLERQEAKHEGVTVDQTEIAQEYTAIEHQNGMKPGQLAQLLTSHGLSKQQLIDQLAVRYLWGSTVHGRYGPELSVSEDEINAKIKEVQTHVVAPANRVAEIFLPVSDPAQDAALGADAQQLVDEIRRGASFPDLARQYSQASSAATGGDLGWSDVGTLRPDIEKIVDRMQPQSMEGPVRLSDGYYILVLIDRRSGGNANDTRYSLTQAVFPLPATATEADAEATVQQARTATQGIHSCAALNALGQKISPDLSGPVGDLTLAQLPTNLRPIVEQAKIAVPFDPLPVRGGIGVFMVCNRVDSAPAIDRNEVANDISNQKFQDASERYLQELRRTAYIDLRN